MELVKSDIQKGYLKATFEEIRGVLEREGVFAPLRIDN